MNFFVLIKDVPDISRITPADWDKEKGTLKRGNLPSQANPLDLKALAFALDLMKTLPGTHNLIAVTMGPSSCITTLRRALACGCTDALLLSDSAFAGSDTLATARILASGILKWQKQRPDQDDFTLICGMQSIDGDTAQVPSQLAAALELPMLPYVDGLDSDSQPCRLRSIVSTGKGWVTYSCQPALITVADYSYQPYPSFHRQRWAVNQYQITSWTLKDLLLSPQDSGLKGSGTQVVKVFQASGRSGSCCVMVEKVEMLNIETLLKRTLQRKKIPQENHFDNPWGPAAPVWLWAEISGEFFHPASIELLGKALELAQQRQSRVEVFYYSAEDLPCPEDLFCYGAASLTRLGQNQPDLSVQSLAHCLAQRAKEEKPEVFLLAATPLGRILAPAIAYWTGAGLTADCTELEWGTHKGREGILLQTRPALGGNIMATIVSRGDRLTMATVRPGVFPFPQKQERTKGEQKEIKVDRFFPFWDIQDISPRTDALSSLTDASILLGFGAGIKKNTHIAEYIQPLARELSRIIGKEVPLCGSRKAVERELLHPSRQVGQTGVTVSPRIYIAIAISGAVQHLAGVEQSDIIIAINRDPAAPMFRYADYGMVGDYCNWIPRWVEYLKKLPPLKKADSNG